MSRIVAHPILCALYPVLVLWSHNAHEHALSQAWRSALLAAMSAAVILAVATVLLKDVKRAGVLTTFLVILFFGYGHVQDALRSLPGGGAAPARHRTLLVLWAVAGGACIYAVIRSKRDLTSANILLNVTFVALLAQPVGVVVFQSVKHSKTPQAGPGAASAAHRITAPDAGRAKPDIYYVVLDGYASAMTLESVFQFDNSSFLDELERMGFTVRREARSNYAVTFLSLASSLNMTYVDRLIGEVDPDATDRERAYEAIDDNEVVRVLRAQGYDFIHYSSGWGATYSNGLADEDVTNLGGISELESVLLRSTVLRPKVGRFFSGAGRKRIIETFRALGSTTASVKPRFVFAHIICPHPPFLFNRHGGPAPRAELALDGANAWSDRAAFVEQTRFVNEMTLSAVGSILRRSPIPPVIVLQSDHGPAASFTRNWKDAWSQPTTENLNERLSILSAVHLPPGARNGLYEEMTPVNTFRVLFDAVLGLEYERMEDRSYFSNYETPYALTDVTDRLAAGPADGRK
jgi:hypothetical protein